MHPERKCVQIFEEALSQIAEAVFLRKPRTEVAKQASLSSRVQVHLLSFGCAVSCFSDILCVCSPLNLKVIPVLQLLIHVLCAHFADSDVSPVSQLLVSNLSPQVTNAHLQYHFESVGKVVKAQVQTDAAGR